MPAPARSPRANPLRAFTHRSYAILWAGALVSNVGTWTETIAVGVHVTRTTGMGGWTGTVIALTYLPAVVMSPIAGALADRFERRRYLLAVTLLQTLLAGTLAGLAYLDHLTLPAVTVLMTLTGCATALVHPVFAALLANAVPAEDLMSAMTLYSAQNNVARITGPMLAAAVIATGGLVWAFTLNAFSFLAVLLALLLLRAPPEPEQAPEKLWSGIRSGIRMVRRDEGTRAAILLTFVTAMLISPFIGLVPVMAIKVFGQGARETSLLMTCQGLGAILSAVASTSLADAFGRRRLMEAAAWLLPTVAAIYWLSPTLGYALLAIGTLGAVYLSVVTGANTVCFSRSPRHVQARASSLFNMVLSGGYATGVVTMGWLGDRFGPRQVGVAACALHVAMLLAQRLFWPTLFRAMDEPMEEPARAARATEITSGRESTG